ncbi:hypothetical protein Ocin01_19325, partial [Orchesella cincta]
LKSTTLFSCSYLVIRNICGAVDRIFQRKTNLNKMTSVKIQRAPVRAAFTKILNELGVKFQEDEKDHDEIDRLFDMLRDRNTRLEILDDSVQVELINNAASTENDFTVEYDSVQGYRDNCVFCGKRHESRDCFTVGKLSLEEKRDRLRKRRACFSCLQCGHSAASCHSKLQCPICQRKHVAVMCPELHKLKRESENTEAPEENDRAGENTTLSVLDKGPVLLQTLILKVHNGNKTVTCRAIIDTGSMRSYITKRAAEVLKLVTQDTVDLAHSLFGGAQTPATAHARHQVLISDIAGKNKQKLEVLQSDVIASNVPRGSTGNWIKELYRKRIHLTDIGNEDREVHILLGADIAGHLFTGEIQKTVQGPVAMTTLGWTVTGPTHTVSGGSNRTNDSSLLVHTLHITDADIQKLWKLDVLGIMDPTEVKSRSELTESALKHFENTVKQLQDGRYEVGLPWLDCHPPIAMNMDVCMKRLESCLRKLRSSGKVVISSITTADSVWYIASSYRRSVRVIAWILRWRKPKTMRYGNLTQEEENEAELVLIKQVQNNLHAGSLIVQQTKAVLHSDGLWRVRTEILMRDDLPDFRRPILIPGNHPITKILIDYIHVNNSHCGVQTLLCIIRERFWITRARQNPRKAVSKCATCRRFTATRLIPSEAPLPADREIREQLRRRFRGEYLGLLLHRNKKGKYSTIVLIEDDQKKRINWKLGRVVELIHGRDGVVRVARVKTAEGELLRPLRRLFPLECRERKEDGGNGQDSTQSEAEVLKTRSGREIKKPVRFQPE